MTLSANTIWEVQTVGNDLNGGGYVTGSSGTDYSRQATAQLTVTDGATSGIGVTTLTSTTGGFTAAMVGSIVHLYTGVNLTDGWYEITAYTDTNTVTLDRAPDDGVGGVSSADVKVGGALGSPGLLSTVVTVDGMKAYIKSGTYTLTTTTAGSAGPLVSTVDIRMSIEGYDTTRGDLGTPPVMDAGVQTGFAFVTLNGQFTGFHLQVVRNLKVDGKSNASVNGFQGVGTYAETTVELCEAANCVVGFSGTTKLLCIKCRAESCTGNGFDVYYATGCDAINGSSNGFNAANAISVLSQCLSRGNNVGFKSNSYNSQGLINCTADGNSSHGFDLVYDMTSAINCIASNNGGYGFKTIASDQQLANCAGYNNTSGNTAHTLEHFDFIALSADPYVNKAGGDFRPNNVAGGGADLRGAGSGVFGQTNNTDIGAVQHGDPAGGAASILGGGVLTGGFS